MPILLKIFLLLLFQNMVQNKPETGFNDLNTSKTFFVIPKATVLYIEGDECKLEDAINICQQGLPDVINRDYESTTGAVKVELLFNQLTDDTRRMLTIRLLQRLGDRLRVEWRAGIL